MRGTLKDGPKGLALWFVGTERPMSDGTPLEPACRSFEGLFGQCEFGLARNHVVKGHGNIGTERPLDLDCSLRGETPSAPVDMGPKLDAVFVDLAEAGQREYLGSRRSRSVWGAAKP
jgi:hypothetical protein